MGVYVKTKLMSMPWECFCFDFSFGTACGAIMFAAANGITISCSFGRWYWPVLSLYFLDVYECYRRQLSLLSQLNNTFLVLITWNIHSFKRFTLKLLFL
jgi:hypothetical protein